MKKVFSFIMVLCLCLTMTSCGFLSNDNSSEVSAVNDSIVNDTVVYYNDTIDYYTDSLVLLDEPVLEDTIIVVNTDTIE